MAKKLYRVRMLAYSDGPVDALGEVVGNDTLTTILGEYEVFDDATQKVTNTINGTPVRQISLSLSPSLTLQQQWDAIVQQAKTDEGIS